jgi:hypothetical protein
MSSVGESPRTVQLWDAMNQELLWSGRCREDVLLELIYSPAANKLFSMPHVGADSIYAFDIASKTTKTIGYEQSFRFFRCSNNGARLLTQETIPHRVGYITSVWNVADGTKLFTQTTPVTLAAEFTADDSKVVAHTLLDCFVCVFDSDTGDCVLKFAAMNDKDEALGVGSKKNICYSHILDQLGVWDCATGDCIFQVKAEGSLSTACFGVNDDSIVASTFHTAGENAGLICWSLIDGSILFKTSATIREIPNFILSPSTNGFITQPSYYGSTIQEYDSLTGAPATGIISFRNNIWHLVASVAENVLL